MTDARFGSGRFSVYVSNRDHRHSVYDDMPSRKRDGSATFLAGYQPCLQADAFGSYEASMPARAAKSSK